MCDSYWYSYTNSRGYQAYLTLNVNDPSESTNSGEWRPTISQTGYYSVEAYIPYHNPINWECPEKIISSDTSDAHYRIYHANGQTLITSTQNIYSNEWLPLGEHLRYEVHLAAPTSRTVLPATCWQVGLNRNYQYGRGSKCTCL
jgi:hypothetical protein